MSPIDAKEPQVIGASLLSPTQCNEAVALFSSEFFFNHSILITKYSMEDSLNRVPVLLRVPVGLHV